MAAEANIENKQTSNKGYRKTKRFPKIANIFVNLYLLTVSAIHLLGVFFAYLQAFLAVVLGYHKAIKKQRHGVLEKKFIKYL